MVFTSTVKHDTRLSVLHKTKLFKSNLTIDNISENSYGIRSEEEEKKKRRSIDMGIKQALKTPTLHVEYDCLSFEN